jgi:hypothetical protein
VSNRLPVLAVEIRAAREAVMGCGIHKHRDSCRGRQAAARGSSDMISYNEAAKFYMWHRLAALEQSPADDGHLIGGDPREMTIAELNDLGHQVRPLLAVIRAKCLDCVGHERSEVRKCVAADCPNWPYRMSHNPFHAASEARRESGRRLAARMARKSENAPTLPASSAKSGAPVP